MRNVKPDKVSAAIEERRKALGMTVGQFGEACGVTRVTMSNVINGKRPASPDILEHLGVETVYRFPVSSTPILSRE